MARSQPVPAADPVERRKLYHAVMERVLDLIREQRLGEGDQLPSERELMERYGVGRPAVREALQNLEWLGIISISHGERARVVQPSFRRLLGSLSLTTNSILWNSERSLDELKQARLLFELQMVRLAADLARPEDVERLRGRLADQVAARPDPAHFVRCDMLFHREIASITRNSIFPALSEAMMGWLGEFYVDLVRAPDAEDLTLAEHGRIVEAIAGNNSSDAERAMSDHVTRANALYSKRSRTARPGA